MMEKLNSAEELMAYLSAQLTDERLAEVSNLSGIEFLAPGILTDLVKDQTFSVEDIVIFLVAGLVLEREDRKQQAKRNSELETLCIKQQKAIDDIADQTTHLRVLLGSALSHGDRIAPLDILRGIAARAGSGSPTLE